MVKKIQLYALANGGDAKTFRLCSSQVLALAPHTSHLVKLSLPNIFFIFPENIPMFPLLTVKKLPLMAHSYCMGPEKGQGPGNDGFYIMLCIVHTIQGQGQGQRTIVAGSLEAAYSLNWGAQEIWGKGGGETLALL